MINLKGKGVLVTGASGFIGSHLVDRLVKEGCEVSILVLYNSIIENIRLEEIWDKVNVIESNIRDIDSLKQIRNAEPEIIFHLAAYNHVGTSFRDVNEVFDVNAKGTANLINSYDGFERFIYISSSEVYGLQDSVPFNEEMQPRPISPYGIAKYCGELYCNMMQQRGRDVVILRPFNTFGPYQSTRAIIPEIIIKCLNEGEVKTTEGKQTREFNYVEDVIEAIVLAAKKKEAIGETINVGNGKEISIKELALKIRDLTCTESKLNIGGLEQRPTEIWRMCADNNKAKKILGWMPKIQLEEGLKRTIEWYRNSRYVKKKEC